LGHLEAGARQQSFSDFTDDLVKSIQKVLNFQNSFEIRLNLEIYETSSEA
jgi:hypothetical protein